MSLPSQPSAPLVPKALIGRVKAFFAAKNYGFIACEETQRKYNADVYVAARELPLGIKPGDSVRFRIRLIDGKPQAFNVSGVQEILGTGAVRETDEHVGTLKYFEAARGFGFLDCAATFELYKKDVFVTQKELIKALKVEYEKRGSPVEMHVGAALKFTVEIHDGKPQARKVHFDSEANAKPEVEAVIYKGEIERVAREYGFIQCKELQARFGTNVYFPARLTRSDQLRQGDVVYFAIQVKGGKPQATLMFQSKERAEDALDKTAGCLVYNGHDVGGADGQTEAEAVEEKPVSAQQVLHNKQFLRACASHVSSPADLARALRRLSPSADAEDACGLNCWQLCLLNGQFNTWQRVQVLYDEGLRPREPDQLVLWVADRLGGEAAMHLSRILRGERADDIDFQLGLTEVAD